MLFASMVFMPYRICNHFFLREVCCGYGLDWMSCIGRPMSGRIPILWTEAAMTDESDRDSYDAFLRWYGEQIHDNLWSKLWMIRTREMAMIEMNDEETSVYTSDIEEEDRSEEA